MLRKYFVFYNVHIYYIQVVNGIRYDLFIKVALSTTCTRDSQLCTSMECPIDEQTLSEWMVSVVASPSVPVNYSVLSTTPVNTVEDTVRKSHSN